MSHNAVMWWSAGLRQRTHSALSSQRPPIFRLNRRPASTSTSSGGQSTRSSNGGNPYAGKQSYSEFNTTTSDSLFGEIPRPPPQDFPPISQRLKPLIPFFIYCTALTSIATHLLRKRKMKEEEERRVAARVSILEGLVGRLREGHQLSDKEIDRELEMVGLKERPSVAPTTEAADDDVESLQEAGTVSWKAMLLGRKRSKLGVKEQEEKAEQEWAEIVRAAADRSATPAKATSASSAGEATTPSLPSSTPPPTRASSSNVYI